MMNETIQYQGHPHHPARSPETQKTSERREVAFLSSAEAAGAETVYSVHDTFQQNSK